MMRSTSNIIIYLDRQKIIVSGPQIATPLTLDVPVSIIQDIDIIDIESFESLLSNWLEQNKITPCQVTIILASSVYYVKDIPPAGDSTQKQSQIDAFLQTIPFKNLLSKDYLFSNKYQLIAINKDFYEPLVKYLEKNHFNVTAIFPILILDAFRLNLASFSPKEAKDIFTNFKTLLPYSLVSAQDIDKSYSQKIRRPDENRPRMIALIGVFSLLFIVLLGFLFIRPILLKNEYQKKLNSNTVAVPTLRLSEPTPEAAASPTIVYTSEEALKIKVVNASGISNQAGKIKELLLASGFKIVVTETSPKITGSKTQVDYSAKVSPESLQKVIKIVKTETENITLKQVGDNQNQDIVVTTVTEIK